MNIQNHYKLQIAKKATSIKRIKIERELQTTKQLKNFLERRVAKQKKTFCNLLKNSPNLKSRDNSTLSTGRLSANFILYKISRGRYLIQSLQNELDSVNSENLKLLGVYKVASQLSEKLEISIEQAEVLAKEIDLEMELDELIESRAGHTDKGELWVSDRLESDKINEHEMTERFEACHEESPSNRPDYNSNYMSHTNLTSVGRQLLTSEQATELIASKLAYADGLNLIGFETKDGMSNAIVQYTTAGGFYLELGVTLTQQGILKVKVCETKTLTLNRHKLTSELQQSLSECGFTNIEILYVDRINYGRS